MRKLVTLTFLLLSGSLVIAQTPWTYTEPDFPIQGDSAFYRVADTAGVTGGASGAMVTWNFSTLNPSGTTVTMRFKAPNAIPTGATFPTATVLYNPSTTDYVFYRNSTDSAIIIGQKSSTNTTINYSDPLYALKFPFDFNESIVDSVKALYPDGFFSQVDRKGEVTTIYDGYGDLSTPAGGFGNTIRIHRIWNVIDSSLTGLATGYSTFHEFWFFEQNQRMPVLRIFDQKTVLNGSNQNAKEVWYNDNFPISVDPDREPQRIAVTTFPNPATDRLTVKFLTGLNSQVSLDVYAADGRLVRSVNVGQMAPGSYEQEMNVSDLAPGQYVLRMNNGTHEVSRPFVIQ